MSRSWIATLGALALLAGCGFGQPEPYATGPRDLVLQMVEIPGVIQPGEPTSIVPAFSMYGDGKVLVHTNGDAGFDGGLPVLRRLSLSKARTAQLVDAAKNAGVQDDKEHDIDIAPEASTTLMTLTAEERSGWVETGPEIGGRLSDLRQSLVDYADADGTTVYIHDAIAVLATPAGTFADPDVPAWPLEELRPNAELRIDGTLCRVYRRVGVEEVTNTARSATPGAMWRSGDETFVVHFRPMLPHESDCESLIHRSKVERNEQPE